MSTDATARSSEQLTLNIKAPGDVKISVTVPSSSTVADLKQAIATEKSDFPKDQQRLIFSGRVLKDEDPISKYGIKNGVAIHLVKGARPAGAASASSTSAGTSEAAGVPSNFAAGQQVMGNPLAPLMNAQYAGALGGFNPFAEMGINPNDPNYLQNLLNSPEAQAQMNRALSDPAVIDQIIQASPELQAMGPQVRQMMQSEHFRNMLSNPQLMQQMMGMMGGGGGMGGAGGGGGFPPPGAFGFGSGAQAGQQGQPQQGANRGLFNPWASDAAPSPGAGAGGESGAAGSGGAAPPFNPFAMFGGGGAAGAGAGGPQMNPMQAMAQLQQMQQLFGGGGGGMGGAGAGQPQQAPEERYATELEQLRGMGFTDATRNVRALLASGGFVDSAVQYLLENP
ncbi:hypothetical protein JCM11641_000501 [Rhodosporidiobolus odoratus]